VEKKFWVIEIFAAGAGKFFPAGHDG
jgi:hypothetical protein